MLFSNLIIVINNYLASDKQIDIGNAGNYPDKKIDRQTKDRYIRSGTVKLIDRQLDQQINIGQKAR